jgi:hypothetical protein
MGLIFSNHYNVKKKIVMREFLLPPERPVEAVGGLPSERHRLQSLATQKDNAKWSETRLQRFARSKFS